MSRKGLTPIRVRRRQSDAKWRASVAICYETLKYIIPEDLQKKKISKALILDETENHITFLEYRLKEILERKAYAMKKGILWYSGDQCNQITLQDMKTDFEEKQSAIFSQSACGRRRYHLLGDIEDQIIDMSFKDANFAIVDNKHK